MADRVSSNKIVDGPRNAVFHFTNVSDGTGENNVAKVDLSALNTGPDGRACDEVAIMCIKGRVYDSTTSQNHPLYISWAGTATDTEIAVIPPTDNFCCDYSKFGGLTNTATGGTNDVLFTFPAATGGAYDVTMEVRKKY